MQSFQCLSRRKKGWRAAQRPVQPVCHSRTSYVKLQRKRHSSALRIPEVSVPGEQAPLQLKRAQQDCTAQPRAYRVGAQVRLPRDPTQHVSLHPAVGRAAPWHESACRFLPLLGTVVYFTFLPLASAQQESCGRFVPMRYPTSFTGARCGGEGTDGSVCWIDPGSVKVLHILSFSALTHQCAPKGQRISLCLGLKGHQTRDLSC